MPWSQGIFVGAVGFEPEIATEVGVVIGIALALTIESFAWAEILFPLWVLVLSIHHLAQTRVDDQAG